MNYLVTVVCDMVVVSHYVYTLLSRGRSRILKRGLGACPPEKFWISDLRSFVVYSCVEIAKAEQPTAKTGCCVFKSAELKVTPLRAAA